MKFTHWEKTKTFTALLSLLTIGIVLVVQIQAGNELELSCSYFDPLAVDILAFIAALFFIVEGSYRLHEHKHVKLASQATRSIRIAFGCAILSLHVIQFLQKI